MSGQDYIYFVRHPDNGRIRIGHTGKLRARMKSLMKSDGFKPELLGVMPGKVKDERALHRKFSQWQLTKDGFPLSWFEPSQEVLEFINNNVIWNVDCDYAKEGIENPRRHKRAFTHSQVKQIREAVATGENTWALAHKYDVAESTIHMAVTGKTYKWASGPITKRPKRKRSPKPTRRRRSSYVYFMHRLRDGAIKIGFSRNVPLRHYTLEKQHGKLDILGVIQAGMAAETVLHALFHEVRYEGTEFFEPSEKLLEFINENAESYETN